MTLIRPVVPADRRRVWDILKPVFRAGDTYAVDPRISAEEALAYWIDAPRACFVAEVDGAVVGTYYIRTNQAGGGDHICNCGYIVEAAVRGRGLARAMCGHSQQIARAMGYRAMQFNFVLASNGAAVQLWQRMGFKIVGTVPQAFRHPSLGLVDAHVMHKLL